MFWKFVGRNPWEAGKKDRQPKEKEPAQSATEEGQDEDMWHLKPTDIVIAVMGMTGSGKSTFVSQFTSPESEGVKIGHQLESCTDNVVAIRIPSPPNLCYDLVFVDTPGFDNTHISDATVLQMISDWLNRSYLKGIHLAGLLYFHRISDSPIMAKTPLKNLRMFQDLCGKQAFTSVGLVTTMWDEVDEQTGDKSELELKDGFWASMIAGGSQVARFDRTYASAEKILDPLINNALRRNTELLEEGSQNPKLRQVFFNTLFDKKKPVLPASPITQTLLLQQEMNLKNFKLWETSAGRQLCPKLDLIEARQKVLQGRIEGMKSTQHKGADLKLLEKELKSVGEELRAAAKEMKDTKFSLLNWFPGGFGTWSTAGIFQDRRAG